jgi:hypothetical protein
MPMMLRSGRLTGTRGILQGHSGDNPMGSGHWAMYIKDSEQKEAQAMLRGEIPILLDPRELINWNKSHDKHDRPSPFNTALARTMCIASGGKQMRVAAVRIPLYTAYLEMMRRRAFHTTDVPDIPMSPHWISIPL